MCSNPQTLSLANGNLYMGHQVFDTYFPSINSVILLSKPPLILIMPVHSAGAGGLLLKIRNSLGDRVVNVSEFFQKLGIDITAERVVYAQWNSEYSALTFSLEDWFSAMLDP